MTKIIDQKGMVFGRINVIDLSVILLLLSFVAVMIIGYLVITQPEAVADRKWISIQIKFAEIEPELVDVIQAGDYEKDLFTKKTIGKLTGISSVKASKAWVMVDGQKLSTIDDSVKKDVIVDAEILCTKKGGIWYYKSSPIKANNTIMFETELYNFSGLIIKMKIDDKCGS